MCAFLQKITAIDIATFSAAFSALFAAISSWQSYKIAKKTKLSQLEKDLEDILKLAIEYPYLESKKFTNEWDSNKDSDDERYLRYDIYCNILYNFIVRVYVYYKGDSLKIENFIDIKNWVNLHSQNWKNPVDPKENIEGYDIKFQKYINSYLRIDE